MRVLRALLIAGLVLLVGCSSGGDPAPESSDAAAPAEEDPTETPTAAASDEVTEEPTEEATEEPTEDATEDVAGGEREPASALFASPPEGYAYTKLPAAAQKQLQGQLGGVENNPIIGDFEARSLNKGATPVAIVFAVRFSEQATAADRKGFDVGVAKGAGAKGQPVTVGGKDMTFIDAAASLYLYSGDDYSVLFFGPRKGPLKAAVADVAQGLE